MNIRMTPLQSKMVAVGLLVMALVIISALVGFPVWKLHQHYDDIIGDTTDKLARYRRAASLRPEIELAIQQVSERDAKQYYLKGSTRTTAEAELQSLVTRLVESRNCRIATSQILPVKDDQKSTESDKVMLSIQLHATIVPLQILLHSIETNKPYLFIENLTIRASHGRAYKPTPGIQPEYVVHLNLAGYFSRAGDTK